MITRIATVLLTSGLLLATSCGPTISDKSQAELNKQVNCSTAENDIKILEDEKASVGKQVVSGVRSVLPVAAVIGLLRSDYGNRVEVATGKYNRDLQNKIDEIRTTCNLPASNS